MSNNKQALELTDITAPLLAATQGYFTMKDRVASTTTPIIDDLLDSAERGENRRNQCPPSISMVPRILRDLSVRSFIPQLVSIGPIHRENKKLKEFEWLKECYLHDLLKRCEDSTPKETILEACLQKVKTKIPKIRESFAAVKKNYDDDELARMMVMDGCFILEFFFKHDNEENLYLQNKMQNTRIAMDLMLLENQVPFFVLQTLFNCFASYADVKEAFTLNYVLDRYLAPYIQLFHSDLLPEKNSILSNVLDKFLAPYMYIKLLCSLLPEKFSTTDVDSDLPQKISTTYVDSDSTPAHVLDYLHKRYQPLVAKSSNPIPDKASKLVYHSIVELDRSGINFKPHQEGDLSMTIEFQSPLFRCIPSWFWSKPTILMPTLVIDDFTELILRNFIAYEQSCNQDRDCFTSYAHAMDMLIDTREDIAKLADSKVLFRKLGSNKEAADMIHKIGRNIFVADFNYTEVFKQVDEYHNGFWPKNIARLRRLYFFDSWKAIAIYYSIIVFFLTVVQTIYTIKGK